MTCLLLVEDSPDITWIVQRLGRREGQEVLCRADVAGAWNLLRERRPDLVLLDLNLPGARGEELCRRVRATPDLAGLRVALFTHWDRPEDVLAGLEAGADYVVSKELLTSPDAWLSRLRDCLGADGRVSPLSLGWTGAGHSLPPSPALVASVNRVLRHPLARQLGPEVLRFVVGRARRDAEAPDAWLLPDGLTLDGDAILRSARPGELATFARALTDRLWCLLGSEAGAPLWEALAAARPPTQPNPRCHE